MMDPSERIAWLFFRYYEKKCTQQEQEELFDLLRHDQYDETVRRLIEETWARELPAHQQDPATAGKILEYITNRFSDSATNQSPDYSTSQSPHSDTNRSPDNSTNHAAVTPAKRTVPVRTPDTGAVPVFARPPEEIPINVGAAQVVPFFIRYMSAVPMVARYAAALFAFVLVSYFTYHYYIPHPATRPPVPMARAVPPATDQCITLSDGSKVLLHKDAHIRYDSVFAGRTREVTLSGEAYFDIRHDRRPFIVHTGNITTTVLGTAFDINEHDRDIVITVAKGKVRVENGAGDYGILRGNEQITVDRVHNRLKKTQVDAGEAIAWKKPYLLFNDANMKDAVLELEQRFHVTIVLMNPALENCNVTATFTGGEPLEQIIKVLSKINNMEYRMNGNRIELNGEGCK